MEFVQLILNNPIYITLFGSGGVIVAIVAIIGLKNKKSKYSGISNHNDININNNINIKNNTLENNEPDNLSIDKEQSYNQLDFRSEEFYLEFLKTAEEKKRKRDRINYE